MRYRRNPDIDLRELEREFKNTNDPELWVRIQRMRERRGLCPHYKTHCTEEHYGNYEDSGSVWSLICNECGETLRSKVIPSWEYSEQAPDWCWDAEDEDWYPARNPLKKSAFEAKLKKLKKLGLEETVAEEIRNDFNSPHNHPSHALYIIDWWVARLSLIKFLENEKDEYVSNLARYGNRYKVDAHDLSLDGALQIDHYAALRHYAHLAQTNPYFRLPWPHIHKIIYQEPGRRRWNYQTHEYELETKIVVGEIREWESKTREGKPAVKILTGANRAVSETVATRIEKDKIIDVTESSGPEELLAFLKDTEDNVETARFFEPVHHEVLLKFPDGKDWVVIRDDDRRAEGSSLRDCATAENKNTILISLREPVTDTHVQALLKAEIVFPKLSARPSLEEIKNTKGIIVQLRGYRNSKPTLEMHPYIIPLLQQKWIVHLVPPNFSSSNTFMLGDLMPDDYQPLRKKKRYLFSAKRFYDKYGKLGYSTRIRDHILEKIDMPFKDIYEILSAKRYNLVMRRKALREFKKRLNRGTKHRRSQLYDVAEKLLFSTKNKSLINDILDIFNGHKKKYKLFLQFFNTRREWLLQERNTTFFTTLIESALPGSGGYYARKSLPKGMLTLLNEILPDHYDFVFKLIYEVRFDDASGKNLRQLLERVLSTIIEDPSKLNYELCGWYQDESVGWGGTQHRSFANAIPLSRKLLKQLQQLIDISIDRKNDCYMDLAVTIAMNMTQEDKDKMKPLITKLTRAMFDPSARSIKSKVYEQLGRFIHS